MDRTAFPRLLLCGATLLIAANAGGAEPVAPTGVLQPVVVKATSRFDFDRATIDEADRARILAEVGKLKDVTWQTVTATGFTDNVGSTGYNKRLSERRAGAIKTYLVGKGLDAAMIETVGHGETDPIATNDSASGRARNRRTEIEFRGVRSVSP